jgi:hypothetical protein
VISGWSIVLCVPSKSLPRASNSSERVPEMKHIFPPAGSVDFGWFAVSGSHGTERLPSGDFPLSDDATATSSIH